MLDKVIFAQGMKILSDLYPDYPIKEGSLDAYYEFLQNLTNLEFERAVKSHVSKSSWFPKVNELLAGAQENKSVMDTWNRLLQAAEAGEKPEMDIAAERALGIFGGWDAFTWTPYETLQFRYKDFRAAYLEEKARETLVLAGGEQKALPGGDE